MAMTPFEKWFHEWWGSKFRKQIPNHLLVLEGWQACAAEAERLCRARVLDPGEHECLACENCADAIAQLREVDR